MKFIITILLFIFLGFLSFMLDIKTASKDLYSLCEEHFPVLLIHHIIWVFTNGGWLSYNIYVLYLYVFSVITHMVLWFIFKNECVLTKYMNDKCKTDSKLRTFFLFIKQKLNLSTNRYLDILIYSLLTGYVFYKLMYKKNLIYRSF